MGLTFTSAQVKNISKEIITLPLKIDNPAEGTGFVQQRESVVLLKDELFLSDVDQKTFSDFWIDTQSRYYTEIEAMMQTRYTPYSESMLQAGGKLEGPHWPMLPIWVHLPPSIVPESNSQNSTSLSGKLESTLVSDSQSLIAIVTNGLSDGSSSCSGAVGTNNIVIDDEVSGFAVGNRGLLSGSTTCLVLISSVSVSTPEVIPPEVATSTTIIGFSILSGTLPSGTATLSNSLPPQSVTIKAMCDSSIALWLTRVTASFTSLSGNDDIPPRKPLNKTELAYIVELKTTIETWQANNDRFSDLGLSEISAKLGTRTMNITRRTNEIYETCLGVLTQDDSGNVSGAGVNFDLFSTVSLRISKATGSLNQYYQVGGATDIFDKKIADAEAKLAQYASIFLVTPLENTEESDFILDIMDTTGLESGDDVMLMDDNSVIYQRTLSEVTLNTIVLNIAIPSILSKGSNARLVKYR